MPWQLYLNAYTLGLDKNKVGLTLILCEYFQYYLLIISITFWLYAIYFKVKSLQPFYNACMISQYQF
ncbi:hypothetical protein M23134_07822 [Microscilla marina ATCC 23134]|uniref:Uncharacterized protein n=1 Tax=Microscilla marina ATCC 23134 TaxID=313606 RepID=A1ZLH0_MICM2|nr:hypothetical protein M23134_07822 [Microscilla marina ATCC 23134]